MSMYYCPHCGQSMPQTIPQARPPVARRLPTHTYQARRVMMGGGEVIGPTIEEYINPIRPGAVEPDVLTPLLQALVSGGLSSLLVAGVAFLWPAMPWYSPMVAIPTVTAAMWFYLLKDARKGLFSVERVEFSPAAPAAVAAPVVNERLHQVKLQVQEDPQHVKYAHLPLDYKDLQVIAKATQNGRSFSLASWAGGGRLLSRSQFETLRDWLLTADYAFWIDESNHNQGIDFNNKGKAFWRALAAA